MHPHLADAELARFALDPDSLTTSRRAAVELAIAECPTCRGSVDFFAVVGTDGEGWEDATEFSADDVMRSYIERLAAEDREAHEIIEKEHLLASATKTAWRNLRRNKRVLTGGVVRKLNAHANSICESEPLDALTFADAAISIAETLPDDHYPWNAVFELRGTAWKERANALLVMGEFPAAHDALTHAERAYSRLESAGLGLATVALVRASVLCEQDRLDEASVWAEKAEHGFAHLGQEERRIRAVYLRGSITYETGDLLKAKSLFQQVLEYADTTDNRRWFARASYALGDCEVDLRNLSEASMRFHQALVIFREIGPERERLATEWGLARIVLHSGNPGEAIRRLHGVAANLQTIGMITDAALVRLDIVEALLAAGEAKPIVELATRIFNVFKNAGMITGALTAAAYIKEAAAAGRLTPTGVAAVRTFHRRADRQPDVVFVPPPETFR